MDPLSIIASVSGLVLFAAKVTSETRAIFDGWRDAPDNARFVLDDADFIISSLKDLEKLLEESDDISSPVATEEKAKFRPVVENFEDTFKKLRSLMLDYRRIEVSKSQRAKWLASGQKEYDMLAQRLEKHKTTLLVKLSLTRSAIDSMRVESLESNEVLLRQILNVVGQIRGESHHMQSPSAAMLFGNRSAPVLEWLDSAASCAASIADDSYTRSVRASTYAGSEVPHLEKTQYPDIVPKRPVNDRKSASEPLLKSLAISDRSSARPRRSKSGRTEEHRNKAEQPAITHKDRVVERDKLLDTKSKRASRHRDRRSSPGQTEGRTSSYQDGEAVTSRADKGETRSSTTQQNSTTSLERTYGSAPEPNTTSTSSRLDDSKPMKQSGRPKPQQTNDKRSNDVNSLSQTSRRRRPPSTTREVASSTWKISDSDHASISSSSDGEWTTGSDMYVGPTFLDRLKLVWPLRADVEEDGSDSDTELDLSELAKLIAKWFKTRQEGKAFDQRPLCTYVAIRFDRQESKGTKRGTKQIRYLATWLSGSQRNLYHNCLSLQATGKSAKEKIASEDLLCSAAAKEMKKLYQLLQQTEASFVDTIQAPGTYSWAIADLDLNHESRFNFFGFDRRSYLDYVVVYYRRAWHTVKDTTEVAKYAFGDGVTVDVVGDFSQPSLTVVDPRTTLSEDAEKRAGELKAE